MLKVGLISAPPFLVFYLLTPFPFLLSHGLEMERSLASSGEPLFYGCLPDEPHTTHPFLRSVVIPRLSFDIFDH